MTGSDLLAHLKKQPIGVACGILCLILGGLIYYRSDTTAEQQAEYEAKAKEAARITSNVTASKNLPEQVTEIQKYTKELESRLVRAGQLAVNLQYFYKLEAENEVKLLDVRQNTVSKTTVPPYTGVPYSVVVQGSFKQVMTFLARLENGRHFCRFNNVAFSKISGAESLRDGMTLTINLELLGQP